MALSDDQLRALLSDPRETLAVELKGWIDPASDEGKAKIARGCLALRNNDGGHLVIGFKDDGKPDTDNVPADVRATYHQDVVQGIVGQFASETFPVDVQLGERDGQLYPVISVPPGVRTPVAAKRDLPGPAGRLLVKDNAVYVRSLGSNNTVSSAEARRTDWERLVRTCFDNREADIGAFVRRHLGALGSLLGLPEPSTAPSAFTRATDLLAYGRTRFAAVAEERRVRLPPLGIREAAVVDGEVPPHAP